MSQADADKWDERYRSGESAEQQPHPLVLRAADLLPPGDALDVACGLGRHTLALAARGWSVTAIDASVVALQRLRARITGSADVPVRAVIKTIHTDLATNEFTPPAASYDLIVMTCYLQRELFARLKQAVRVNGLFVAVIALIDEDPRVKPMNPAFCLKPGELVDYFDGWELIHACEGKPADKPERRAMAEIIARRLQ